MRTLELVAISGLCGLLLACGSRNSSSPDQDCLPSETDPFVAGSYVSTSHSGDDATHAAGRPWRYLRGPDRVGFEHPDRGLVEVWTRAPNGELRFARWFPQHQRAITYTSGELASLGRHAEWDTVSAVVPPDVRTALSDAGKTKFRCLDATVHRGELDGKRYELVWLTKLVLPARLTVTTGGARHELVLESVETGDAVARALARGRDYAAMDYADIGDHESDPFVARLIAQGFVEHPTEHDH